MWENYIKINLKCRVCGLNWTCSGHRAVVGFCEHSNWSSGSIKRRNFFNNGRLFQESWFHGLLHDIPWRMQTLPGPVGCTGLVGRCSKLDERKLHYTVRRPDYLYDLVRDPRWDRPKLHTFFI